MNLLEFKDIRKSFEKKEVLKGVSFSIKEGEIFGLIGLSGGGKSTLFNIMMGLVKKDSGEIFLEEKEVSKNLENLKRNTGFATQMNMLFDELTIKENCIYFGALFEMKKEEIKRRTNELLKLFNLNGYEDTLVKNLSGGMMKRANLLVSLIHNPKILLLDEPTVGLDPILRNVLWDYIHEINKTGKTIFVTSHLIEEVEQNCNRVAILKKGKIVAIGSISAYKKAYGNLPLNEIFNKIMKDENL